MPASVASELKASDLGSYYNQFPPVETTLQPDVSLTETPGESGIAGSGSKSGPRSRILIRWTPQHPQANPVWTNDFAVLVPRNSETLWSTRLDLQIVVNKEMWMNSQRDTDYGTVLSCRLVLMPLLCVQLVKLELWNWAKEQVLAQQEDGILSLHGYVQTRVVHKAIMGFACPADRSLLVRSVRRSAHTCCM